MSFNADYYVHDSDKSALKALKAIPVFSRFLKSFMSVWSERQYRILKLSGCIRINENQMSEYYQLLPPICEKLGIDIPELYLELDVNPNAYTFGDTKPFIVVTSGLFETLPEELIPTVLAHECGHIACHHSLYTTMGNVLFGGANYALNRYVPFGDLVTMPLQMAFFYWMRCSELSADRAAILCDGNADKMSEVCMRLAGYDKDIRAIASKEEFLKQAEEYREMIKGSKWNRTLEFLLLRNIDHPLMTVRTLECEEWGKSDRFQSILNGTFGDANIESLAEITKLELDPAEEANAEEMPAEEAPAGKKPEKKPKFKLELPKFKKGEKEAEPESEKAVSVPEEIRQYKALCDEGIISQEEFDAKKKQLLGL